VIAATCQQPVAYWDPAALRLVFVGKKCYSHRCATIAEKRLKKRTIVCNMLSYKMFILNGGVFAGRKTRGPH
jgi:hypothetical protein